MGCGMSQRTSESPQQVKQVSRLSPAGCGTAEQSFAVSEQTSLQDKLRDAREEEEEEGEEEGEEEEGRLKPNLDCDLESIEQSLHCETGDPEPAAACEGVGRESIGKSVSGKEIPSSMTVAPPTCSSPTVAPPTCSSPTVAPPTHCSAASDRSGNSTDDVFVTKRDNQLAQSETLHCTSESVNPYHLQSADRQSTSCQQHPQWSLSMPPHTTCSDTETFARVDSVCCSASDRVPAQDVRVRPDSPVAALGSVSVGETVAMATPVREGTGTDEEGQVHGLLLNAYSLSLSPLIQRLQFELGFISSHGDLRE